MSPLPLMDFTLWVRNSPVADRILTAVSEKLEQPPYERTELEGIIDSKWDIGKIFNGEGKIEELKDMFSNDAVILAKKTYTQNDSFDSVTFKDTRASL